MWMLTLLAGRADGEVVESCLLADDLDPPPLAVSRFDAEPGTQSIEALFTDAPEPASIERLTAGLSLIAPPKVEIVADQNWVARVEATLSPVTAGRFVVHGPHDRHKVDGGQFAIEIEAGEAFGTAHHPTTRGCLIAIDRLLAADGSRQPGRSLDLGCGSGVLAIAIARMTRQPLVVASDLDRRSVEVADDNFRKNGVAEFTKAIVADGFAHPLLAAPAQFDLVVANILAEPLVELAPAVARSLTPVARLVLSGLLDEQAATVRNAYLATGLVATETLSLDGWSTLVFVTEVAATAPAH